MGPLLGIVSMLGLYGDVVTKLEWRKVLTASGELFCFHVVSLGICLSPGIRSLSPLISWLKLARLERKKISENTAKHDLCR